MYFPVYAGDLLPHSPPMICIDTLLSASDTDAEAETRLVPDHILLHNGFICEAGYVELAAQTAGALKGYWERKKGLPIREGFLVAAQDFLIHAKAKENDILTTCVSIVAEVNGVNLLEGLIRRTAHTGEHEMLAHGKFKVFVVPSNA